MLFSIGNAQSQDQSGADGTTQRRLMPMVVAGGAWIVAAKIVSQLAQIATFFVAVRVLSPAEFGLFAFVSAVAMLLVVVAEGGWAEFLMKAPHEDDCFDEVATTSLLSGAFFTALGLVVATIFYVLMKDQMWSLLLGLFSCWMLPSALTAAFDGLLVVDGRLGQRAIVRVMGEVSGLITAAVLLRLYGHASALAAAKIVCQLILLIGSICATKRLPRLRLTRSMFAEIATFSRQIVGNRLIVFLGSYSGTLVVGSFLGVADAGFYRAAERVVAVVSELLGEPTRSLSWVVFRRANLNPDAPARSVGSAGVRFLVVLLAIATPMYLGLAQLAEPAVHLVLGEVWLPAASIVPFLCLRQLLLSPGYINEASLSVVGAIRYRLPVTLLNVSVSLAVIVLVARFGLRELAIAQCFTAAFALATCIVLQTKFATVNWLTISKAFIMLILPSSLMMVETVLLIRLNFSEDFPWRIVIFFQITIGVLMYASVLTALLGLNRALLQKLRLCPKER
ncbi:O-antigen/teichoic acid export membrane protein [Rhizobium sp. ERR 922]|uniref:oligosaccharide flippase family protein n=1 Tax=unclassified Rhizobium TaxID=2613769 RepID=UPI00119F638C|nr:MULTISPECIES: oligosaccharide flippase family protein [unclassified Rhizobium]TWB43590.1 O-antigen/teichoic acid export membrane protein [Rhizobium sp. ERR 922]TWB87387.1 O-antigen/teichoic acid export membrane protein [Rhizobium sp. ERR 942]